MIDYIDELLREVAADMRQRFKGYPKQSPEYTIMTQDLSRQPAASKALLPDNALIGSPQDRRDIYRALRRARREQQEFFIIFYVKRWGRKKKMAELGCTKTEMYLKRDQLHSYLLGLIDAEPTNSDVQRLGVIG